MSTMEGLENNIFDEMFLNSTLLTNISDAFNDSVIDVNDIATGSSQVVLKTTLDYVRLKVALHRIYKIAMPTVLVLGFIGNTINLMTLWGRRKELASVSYTYLRGMAVADFMIIVQYIIYLATQFLIKIWERTKALAIYNAFFHYSFMNGFIAMSNLLIMAVTVDRYISICHPLKALSMRNHLKARVTVIVIVVVAFLLQIPEFVSRRITQFLDRRHNVTYWDAVTNKRITAMVWYSLVWPWIYEFVVHLVPIGSLLILNPLIVIAYKKSAMKRHSLTQTQETTSESAKRIREERHLTILLGSISAIFLLLTIPICMTKISQHLKHYGVFHNTTKYELSVHVANLLEVINYAINFYAYSVSNSTFRKAVKNTLASPIKCMILQTMKKGKHSLSNSRPSADTAATHVSYELRTSVKKETQRQPSNRNGKLSKQDGNESTLKLEPNDWREDNTSYENYTLTQNQTRYESGMSTHL